MKNQKALELDFHHNEKKVKPGGKFAEVDCEITRKDFEGMTYYCDSGMFDITTQNAAALALKRKVKVGHVVRILKDGRKSPFFCKISGQTFPLSCDLDEVFGEMERGIFKEGFHFRVILPKDLVR